MVSGAEFMEFTFNGIVLGSILSLAAVGLTLVYGILNLSNFAHGDFLTLGAYFSLMFAAYDVARHPFADEALPPIPWALVIALLLVALVAVDAFWTKRLRRTEQVVLAGGAAALLLVMAGMQSPTDLPGSVKYGLPLLLAAAALGAYITRPGERRMRWIAIVGLGLALGLVLFLAGSKVVLSSVLAILLAVAFGLVLEAALWKPLRDGILANATFALFGALLGALVWMFVLTKFPGLDTPVAKWALLLVFLALGGVALWLLLRDRRHIGRATVVTYIIVTIGLALALRAAIALRFGGVFARFPGPLRRAEPLFLGIEATEAEVAIVVVALVAIALVHVILRYTKVGKAMRALSDNMELARVSGIDVDRVILYVWVLAMTLTALGGILLAQKSLVHPELGWSLLLYIFASVILGGIGSAYGAMAGGFTIGLATEWTAIFAEEYKFAVAFGILILVLLVRPEGILGGKLK